MNCAAGWVALADFHCGSSGSSPSGISTFTHGYQLCGQIREKHLLRQKNYKRTPLALYISEPSASKEGQLRGGFSLPKPKN